MYYLRFQADYLKDAQGYRTLRDAKAEFKRVAEELDRYGQSISASIHNATSLETLDEYPDLILTFDGVRVRTEQA